MRKINFGSQVIRPDQVMLFRPRFFSWILFLNPIGFLLGFFKKRSIVCYTYPWSKVVNPLGKNLFKVSKITLEHRSLNVVRTLFCWLWTGFCPLGRKRTWLSNVSELLRSYSLSMYNICVGDHLKLFFLRIAKWDMSKWDML